VAVQAAGALVARRLRAGEAMLVEGGGTIAVLEPEERRRDLALLPMQRRAPEKPARNAKESASFVDADPLARARLLRSRGQFAQAAALYESIHAASPRTPSGRAALLGLAELRLSDLHDAAGALRAFDAYLAGGSSALAREAAYGRIRALRALGNTEQERAAVQAFLVAYPDGPEAESLRPHLPSARERGAR
jgi:tetratricopeptide (TPR) repeat protein